MAILSTTSLFQIKLHCLHTFEYHQKKSTDNIEWEVDLLTHLVQIAAAACAFKKPLPKLKRFFGTSAYSIRNLCLCVEIPGQLVCSGDMLLRLMLAAGVKFPWLLFQYCRKHPSPIMTTPETHSLGIILSPHCPMKQHHLETSVLQLVCVRIP